MRSRKSVRTDSALEQSGFELWVPPACDTPGSHTMVRIHLPPADRKLFRAALDDLAVAVEPVNRVLEVDLDGDEVTLALYDWPSTQP